LAVELLKVKNVATAVRILQCVLFCVADLECVLQKVVCSAGELQVKWDFNP